MALALGQPERGFKRMFKSIVMLCMLAGLASTACATEVYQWTDAQGKAHASDRPPSKPAGKVRRENSKVHELTPRQREEAASRAKAERARSRVPAPVPPVVTEEAPIGRLDAPPQKQVEDTECQRMTRLYRESEACFAPYKLWNGGTRPEAFEHCTEVVEPSIQCGYVR